MKKSRLRYGKSKADREYKQRFCRECLHITSQELTMEMIITFPGGKRVNAYYKGFTIETDQPEGAGGDGSAPSPFDLFLASIGTCVGYYVLGFCQERGIPTEGLKLTLGTERKQSTGLIGEVAIEISLPPGFPEKYRGAVKRAAELCAVKRHLENPPHFEITTTVS